MRNKRRSVRWGVGAAIACVTSLITWVAAAQNIDPSQMMSIFNGLSSDQQQALIQQLGGAAGGSSSSGTGGATSSIGSGTSLLRQLAPGNGVNGNSNDLLRMQRRNADTDSDSMLPASLRPLKPGDTILLEVDIQGEGRPSESGDASNPQLAQGTGIVPARTATQQQSQTQQNGEQNRSPTSVTEELTARDRERLKSLIDQLRERNPYVLDRNGALLLPGFAPMQLAGLNDELASKRVGADPALRQLDVKVLHLPLTKTGQAALKPYGYDFFDDAPSTFAPVGDTPVPSNYIVGPGDELNVQLYGSQNRTMRLTVGRDGRVSFPELGPISVAGRSYSAVLADIEARVSRQMTGVRASLGMGQAGSIRVFVMGEAKYPGSYTVSSLTTVTGALFAAGGVKPIGSLRTIQVKRQGQLIRQLDLYDLLMRGDTANDVSLQSGDVILIPPVGPTAIAEGEVRRPGIYELLGNITANNLVGMAGGFTPDADTGRFSLTRVNEQRQRVVLDIDPAAAAAQAALMRNGDALRVPMLRPTIDSGVIVRGEVFRPGNFAWREGLRLSDVIGSVNELKPNADEHYLLIRREVGVDRRITAVSADLTAALNNPRSDADIPLTEHDQVMVFDLGATRDRLVKPLMTELKLQAGPQSPAKVVSISGRVKAAGDYPLDTDMRVADLIRAGGGLEDAAYGGNAELSRDVIEDGQTRRTQVIQINLAAALRGDTTANLLLQPFDGLYIKQISGWSEEERVILKGEVRFPGTYPIKRGDTLHAVLERAGGLTDLAFAQGSVFTRDELKKHEQEQLDRLAERMKSDLVSVSLMAARANQAGASQTYTIGQQLLDQIKSSKAVGRLVIDLPAIVRTPSGSAEDVILRNGDELIVPKQRQEVTVMGEVQNSTSHLYQAGRSRDDYVALSGGSTRQADRNKTYVVRADGSVVANGSSWWFRGGSVAIRTGDTIVVPLDTERTPALPFWQAVTQIIYNLAISAAAVNSF